MESYHTIVIGGGMAGLTAAVYLTRAGEKTLLIEKNEKCGGLVSTFTHNGFYFDAGLRALEDAGIIFPMLKDLGLEMKVVPSPVSVGIENQILNIKDINSLNDYKQLLIKFYPESSKEIDRIITIIRKIMKHMEVLYGIENPVFKNLKRDYRYIFKQLLPWLPKFLLTFNKINRLNIPVEDYVQSIVKNSSLKDIITQHFFKNTPAFFALSYFSLYLDYFYPIGGTGKLPELLQNKLIELGGNLKIKTIAKKIDLSKKIVIDDKNNTYHYENLVWAADLSTFYRISEIIGLNEIEITKFKQMKSKLKKTRGGDSVYTLFVEVDEPLDSFREISEGHLFYTPSKKGLGKTHWEELDELLKNWNDNNKSKIIQWLDKFIKLNTFEISIPGLKDPNLVPQGKTGLIISVLAEYDLFKKVKLSGWYDEFIEIIENKTIRLMTETLYPWLENKIIHKFSFTPISIENRVGSSQGAITGWTFKNPIPVVHKVQLSDRSVLTPIKSVYQAGQWAYCPAGVPIAILTGKLASDKILNKK